VPDADRRLVRDMLAGDERAFERFFDGFFPRLYRFALRRLGGDEDAAEEVAQAAICKGIRRLDTWRGEAALFTWLCTIGRREIHDRVSRGRPGGRTVELVEDRDDVRAALESLRVSPESPVDALLRHDLVRLVWVALDRLPARYGRVLEWKYIEDRPVRDIAARLDVSEKAAESLLTRSRDAFRDAFDALLDGSTASPRITENG
jgi:RNA polymerase sigma-70 factor (ECF subfamily)